MTIIEIKKDDLIDIQDDICIYLFENKVTSNVVLEADKSIRLPDEKGWKVHKFVKIDSKLCSIFKG